MAGSVIELLKGTENALAKSISHMYSTWDFAREEKKAEWNELQQYIFATDTSKTSNKSLPWKNSTTLPKLCQIRDNLHSNYISSLFPNDNWLRWEGYSSSDSELQKRKAIQAYMSNKAREGGLRDVTSSLLLDYIDYGNVFGMVSFVNEERVEDDGTVVPGYVGPKLHRISPLDIVFNPLAASFEDSPKIIRSIKHIGEIIKMAEDEPENAYLQDVVSDRMMIADMARSGTITDRDFEKAQSLQIQGFGSITEYYQQDYVEVLELWGDVWDSGEKKLHRNSVVTVIDRRHVIRKDKFPSWFGKSPIFHAGWRKRPDNLWAMSPLENLVGMQYRIDHLENLKADAMDLAVMPPLKIIGEVEEFTYAPGEEIHIDGEGDVQPLVVDRGMVIADSQIAQLQDQMELFAGAPREAAGIRTPGEKTAFEVQQLNSAAGRIFQEKVTNFEITFLEPALNMMFEYSKRHMSTSDVVRVYDDELGVETFLNVSREDIVATGKLRPIGARHFGERANMLQNLNQIMNGAIGQILQPHVNSDGFMLMIEDVIGGDKFNLFEKNAALFDDAERQEVAAQIQEDALAAQGADVDGIDEAIVTNGAGLPPEPPVGA